MTRAVSDSLRIVSATLIGLVLLVACTPSSPPEPESNAERADRLAREQLIVDTHIDVPYRLTERYEDVGTSTEHGDFDYPRARAGGLAP